MTSSMKKRFAVAGLLVAASLPVTADVVVSVSSAEAAAALPTDQAQLREIVGALDRRMFDAYNAHDLDKLMSMFSVDLEFYHDTVLPHREWQGRLRDLQVPARLAIRGWRLAGLAYRQLRALAPVRPPGCGQRLRPGAGSEPAGEEEPEYVRVEAIQLFSAGRPCAREVAEVVVLEHHAVEIEAQRRALQEFPAE